VAVAMHFLICKSKFMRPYVVVGLPVAVLIGLGSYGVGLGLGADADSRGIFDNAFPAILRGSYEMGRSYGNPLYEFVAAWLYAAGGVTLVNIYSLLLATAAVFIFNSLLNGTDDIRRFIAVIGFALNPIFLIQSSGFGEWMQTYFLLVCLLWSVSRWLASCDLGHLLPYAFFSMALVLTRPDAFFLCFSLACAMIWQRRFELVTSLQVILVSVVAGVATFAIFVLINGGFKFLQNIAFDYSTPTRSFIVAVVGLLVLFGFVGTIVLTGITGWLLIELKKRHLELSFWSRIYLLFAIVGLARFWVLPQKPEYIFPLLILGLLMIAHERVHLAWAGLFSISAILPSLFTISLFHRDVGDDRLSIRLNLGPSAIAQDWAMAKANAQGMDPSFLSRLADQVYADRAGVLPSLFTTTWGPGIQSTSGDLIIGESEAYRLDSARHPPKYLRKLYHEIFICNKSLFGGTPGWRFMQQPPARTAVDVATGKIDVQCHRENPSVTHR